MNVLEFAINMELDGEKHYNDQAEITIDTSLKTVFLILAKDENSHAEILQKRSDKLSYKLEVNGILILL